MDCKLYQVYRDLVWKSEDDLEHFFLRFGLRFSGKLLGLEIGIVKPIKITEIRCGNLGMTLDISSCASD